VFVILSGCASPGDEINFLKSEEDRLRTGGDLAKYHYLVREPYSVGLRHDGFIVGIEKSPKTIIGFGNSEAFDKTRFKPWGPYEGPSGTDEERIWNDHLEARIQHFRKVTNDPKSMFVSHILEYGLDEGQVRMNVSPLYLAYRKSGFADQPDPLPCPPAEPAAEEEKKPIEYRCGWKALDLLHDRIKRKLRDAAAKGNAYTHIIVSAMGWNNDQVESVRRYNALVGNIIAQARMDDTVAGNSFNPLVIGLTWPSVWGGDSFFNVLNKVLHITSYGVKANDADEIGYTIANYLVNNILPRLGADHNFETVLIGHSFGARITSRAMFSGHLLKNPPSPGADGANVLLLDLEGAYSVRRYKADHRLPFFVRPFNKGEGAPYLVYRDLGGKVVLTWSSKDRGNPASRYLTGAKNVGARLGYELSLKIKDTFEHLVWIDDDEDLDDAVCNEYKDDERILMVDASSVVFNHNDILNRGMGRFIWQMISCFTYPR